VARRKAVVVNAVVKVVALVQKAVLAKPVTTAPTKPRPIPPAVTALKVDADVDVVAIAVAKKRPSPIPPTWPAMP
jgi:hypothetical protein